MTNIKRTVFLPLLDKEAGLTETDTALHFLDVSDRVPPGCVAVIVNAERKTGSGSLDYFPGGDDTKVAMRAQTLTATHIVALLDRKLYYKLTNANDTFDVSFFGMLVSRV